MGITFWSSRNKWKKQKFKNGKNWHQIRSDLPTYLPKNLTSYVNAPFCKFCCMNKKKHLKPTMFVQSHHFIEAIISLGQWHGWRTWEEPRSLRKILPNASNFQVQIRHLEGMVFLQNAVVFWRVFSSFFAVFYTNLDSWHDVQKVQKK